jgi:S1-C subfamily serine protease
MGYAVVPSQILKLLSDATAEVVEKVKPSVVSVNSRMGGGSGVAWSSDGYVVTCGHVVGRRSTVRVSTEGSSLEAKVIGQDPYHDVALLKTEGGTFKPIEIGNSDDLKIGQFVIALANPFNQPTATSGMITSVGGSPRRWEEITMENVVITDVPLNPGYSGGPLIDASGKMIGLNKAYARSRGVATLIGTVKSIVDRLAQGEAIRRAYLGINSDTIPLPREIAMQAEIHQEGGVIVLSVRRDSPAKRAGLAFGDVIVKFNEKPVTSPYDWYGLLTEDVIGKEVKLRILREEKLRELTITPTVAEAEIEE